MNKLDWDEPKPTIPGLELTISELEADLDRERRQGASRIDEKDKIIAEACRILRKLEFSDFDFSRQERRLCPICDWPKDVGNHPESCPLAAFLDEHEIADNTLSK